MEAELFAYTPLVKPLVSGCQASGMHAKRASAGHKNNSAAACSCFLTYQAALQPAANRTDSMLSWVVSRDRSYGFLWADSIIHNREERRPSSGLFSS
jgi:hydroxyethylthiazole kinase-like sugar kinase family protein